MPSPRIVVRLASGRALHVRHELGLVTVCGERLGNAYVEPTRSATCQRCLTRPATGLAAWGIPEDPPDEQTAPFERCALECPACSSAFDLFLPADAPAKETLGALRCIACGGIGLRFARPEAPRAAG